MQATIATSTAEAAPSPLDEMYWSWATGYRHFVFNFEVDAAGELGEGEAQLSAGQRGHEIRERLALDGGDDRTVDLDGIGTIVVGSAEVRRPLERAVAALRAAV